MTSTTIEAQIKKLVKNIDDSGDHLFVKQRYALKVVKEWIEAEKLKGQIGELKRYERNWSNRTDFADLDYMNKRLQSLQQQLDSLEEGE